MLSGFFRAAALGATLFATAGCNTVTYIDKNTCIAQDQEGLGVDGIIIRISFFLSTNSYLHRGCELGNLLQNLAKKSLELKDGNLKILHPEILTFIKNILDIQHNNPENEDLHTAMGMVGLALKEMGIIPHIAESLEALMAIASSPPIEIATGGCRYTGRVTSAGLEVQCSP